MALAKERAMRNPQPGFVQARGSPPIQGFDPSSLEFYGFKGSHASMMLEDGGCSNPPGTYPIGHLPPLSNPSNSSSSNVFVFGAVNSTLHESMPVISFNAAAADNWAYSSSSVLSFDGGDQAYCSGYPKLDHEGECASWIDGIDRDYQLNHLSLKSVTDSRLAQDDNCFEIANGYGMASNVMKDNRHGEEQFGLIFSDAAIVDSLQEGGGQESCSQKRPYKGDDAQDPKMHCGNGRKSKAKHSQTKDPQSVAAKNRRERISERLKTLQELVPNGTKVDLVTMLEKAISYVKFLQLQVKVLATDEFWPAQGGKAPEVAQVKEAIDAILASHKR